jgi:hypothetical protein
MPLIKLKRLKCPFELAKRSSAFFQQNTFRRKAEMPGENI